MYCSYYQIYGPCLYTSADHLTHCNFTRLRNRDPVCLRGSSAASSSPEPPAQSHMTEPRESTQTRMANIKCTGASCLLRRPAVYTFFPTSRKTHIYMYILHSHTSVSYLCVECHLPFLPLDHLFPHPLRLGARKVLEKRRNRGNIKALEYLIAYVRSEASSFLYLPTSRYSCSVSKALGRQKFWMSPFFAIFMNALPVRPCKASIECNQALPGMEICISPRYPYDHGP